MSRRLYRPALDAADHNRRRGPCLAPIVLVEQVAVATLPAVGSRPCRVWDQHPRQAFEHGGRGRPRPSTVRAPGETAACWLIRRARASPADPGHRRRSVRTMTLPVLRFVGVGDLGGGQWSPRRGCRRGKVVGVGGAEGRDRLAGPAATAVAYSLWVVERVPPTLGQARYSSRWVGVSELGRKS